jgi:hypothetical protein
MSGDPNKYLWDEGARLATLRADADEDFGEIEEARCERDMPDGMIHGVILNRDGTCPRPADHV